MALQWFFDLASFEKLEVLRVDVRVRAKAAKAAVIGQQPMVTRKEK